jgi:hypothetical protein
VAARRYAESVAFAEWIGLLEAAAATAPAWGMAVSLEAVFRAVNQRYFQDRHSAPRLEWTAGRTRRKLGHYSPLTDTIVISRSLDDPRLPECLVEFVMYHELLHRELGVEVVNGRRYAHTRRFRELERRFEHFEAVQELLSQPDFAGGHPD